MLLNKREDGIISELSKLYKKYGYTRYKPGCFEEYSIYQENKDFLLGKNVITFSDLDGKLLAMRPDVTLSLVRHNEINGESTEKFFYNEKVYRQVTGGKKFKEISQTGVEVLGCIDSAVETELTLLICKTLNALSDRYVVDISHMGFIEGLLSEVDGKKCELTQFVKTKNLHDFYELAESENYSEEIIQAFKSAINICGSPSKALCEMEKVILNDLMQNAVNQMKALCRMVEKYGFGDKINVNLSTFSNADYYNGLIYNGYIDGIPHCVLTGGRYDNLLKKFNKSGGAIGFALYLGEIERFLIKDEKKVDCLIVYDNSTQSEALDMSQKLIAKGKSVRISVDVPAGLACTEIIKLSDGGIK